MSPMNATPAFSGRRRTPVRSTPAPPRRAVRCALVSPTSPMSDFSSGSATPSSNRPPLNQATVSKPTRPPSGHQLEEVAGDLDEALRSRTAHAAASA